MRSAAQQTAPLLPRRSKVGSIEQDIRERIARGELTAGTMLPGRHTLAREYGVALATLERAVDNLLTSGVLRADNGRGTFVVGGRSAVRTEPLKGVTVGIVAPCAYDFRVRILTEQMEQACSRQGGSTRFVSRTPGEVAERPARGDSATVPIEEAAAQVAAMGAEVLLLVGYYDRPEIVAAAARTLRGKPMVCITSGALADDAPPYVYYDNADAGAQAVRHLMTVGNAKNRRIVLVAPFSAQWAEERIAGAEREAAANGWQLEMARGTPNPAGTLSAAWEVPDHTVAGIAALENTNVLRQEECFVGVSDHVTYGILTALQRAGRRPARDVRVVGIGDSVRSRSLGLTTLRPPLEEMAVEAVRLLGAVIADERVPQRTLLKPRLVLRSTT